MLKVFEDARNRSAFLITCIDRFAANRRPGTFKLIWCRSGELRLRLDHEPFLLRAGEILCVAPNQNLELQTADADGFIFQYNREFYCILDHDQETGCAGLLYYGSTAAARIEMDEDSRQKMERLFQVFDDEFDTRDNIQEEMLRMLLKRMIILCTRWFKEQSDVVYDQEELDVIRKFHILVEQHFREKQTVADFARLLNRSPKTLANLFAQNREKPPLRQIQERIALEAKRMLLYTRKSSKQIGWELGFEEDAHFSRFFKRLTGYAPTAFRSSMKEVPAGSIDK